MITRREWLLAASAAAATRLSAAETIPSRILRAGPFTLEFEPELAFLRYIRLGDVEILRGIYAAVRDSTWLTVLPKVTNVSVDEQDGGFRLTFDADCQEGPIHFVWRGTVIGRKEGTLRFDMEGEAKTSFQRNRIGFCVLHPLRECVGKQYIAETASGQTVTGVFPRDISPHQPVKNLRALSHEAAPGVSARVEFEGDVFEMEDHRNWTDGNFKTYCTPLERPFPVDVPAGTRIRQSVELTLKGTPPAPRTTSAGAVVIDSRGLTPTLLPAIGFGWTPSPKSVWKALDKIHPSHLRVDLHLNGDWQPTLEQAIKDAKSIEASLEIAAFVGGDPAGQLKELAARVRGPVARWLIFPPDAAVTPPETLSAARKVLPPESPIGGGTNLYFTELNRERPKPALLSVAAYSINPQVHAFDNRSLIENLEPQGDTVLSARKFLGATPIAVSPVTLRPRFNPQARPWRYDDPKRFDPRQSQPFAAAWTLGSVKYLAEAGAKSITYFETSGPGGCFEEGRPYPVFSTFEAVLPFAGAQVMPLSSSDPLKAVALWLKSEKRSRLLVANLTPNPTEVEIRTAIHSGKFSLRGYEVKRLDLKG